MFTVKFEGNNEVKMNEKKFKEVVKWTVEEIGEFDAIYYIESDNRYWLDVFSEYAANESDFEWESYEITNGNELLEKIGKIVHW